MRTWIPRLIALLGGAIGAGIAVTFMLALRFDAWPFLSLVFLLSSAAVIVAVLIRIDPLLRSFTWLAVGVALVYLAFLSGFTVGLYIFPAAVLVFLAGLTDLRNHAGHLHRLIRPLTPPTDSTSGPEAWTLEHPRQMPDITPRERDVLRLITEGKSNQEIAAHLVISPNTVRHHVHQVLQKVGASSRHEAAEMARAAGWFTRGPDAQL
jgi:DNA-binding CsgD family transcriptional regulator